MIEILIEKKPTVNVLHFFYNGSELITPLHDIHNQLQVSLNEEQIKPLMNMCINALRDIREAKAREDEMNKERVKFIGIDL